MKTPLLVGLILQIVAVASGVATAYVSDDLDFAPVHQDALTRPSALTPETAPRSRPVFPPTGLKGIWEGTGVQDNKSSWSIRISIAQDSCLISYPSLNCGGTLYLVDSGEERMVFQEDLNYGLNKCINKGRVIITKTNDNSARYEWFYPSGKKGAVGSLYWVGESPATELVSGQARTGVDPGITNSRLETLSEIKVLRASASSQYPTDASSYYPRHSIDKDLSTAWFPRRTEMANRGEWLRLDMDREFTLKEIHIINGWIKSDSLWRQNSRIRNAILEFSDGSQKTIALRDIMSKQVFSLDSVRSKWVKIVIETIYPGRVWNHEAGITEVALYGAE